MRITNYSRAFLVFIFCFVSADAFSTPQISVLTHGPGHENYSAFGHSAIRVFDETQGLDNVYNYGVFNYRDPNFIRNFALGRMDYYLEKSVFKSYIRQYMHEGRSTHEQIINLDSAETLRLISGLEENAKEENKYYRYDFMKDNCSSRILDMLIEAAPNIEVYKNLNIDNKSYKRWIDDVYRRQHRYWVTLGVRILLGNRINNIPTSRELSFLPEQLEELLMKSSVRGQPLVTTRSNLSPDNIEFEEMPFYRRPNFVIPVIAFALMLIFLRSKYRRSVFNGVYILLGLLGALILFLWLFTEHKYFSMNWNILWASPLLLALPFLKDTKHHWYKTWLSYSYFLVLVLQFFLKEPFPHEVIPLVFVIWLSLIRFKKFFKSSRSILSWKR